MSRHEGNGDSFLAEATTRSHALLTDPGIVHFLLARGFPVHWVSNRLRDADRGHDHGKANGASGTELGVEYIKPRWRERLGDDYIDSFEGTNECLLCLRYEASLKWKIVECDGTVKPRVEVVTDQAPVAEAPTSPGEVGV